MTPEQEIAARSRRSFIALGAGAVTAFAAWELLHMGPTEEGDIPPAFRSVLGFNERVVRTALYDNDHLAKTFPASAIGKIRANGMVGLPESCDCPLDKERDAAWRL